MKVSNKEISVRNKLEPVQLTDSDIPGAKLTNPIDGQIEMVASVLWDQSANLMEQETTKSS